MAAAKNITSVDMSHTKSTKNFERFDATDDAAAVSNVYITKGAFNGTVPSAITVTVAAK